MKRVVAICTLLGVAACQTAPRDPAPTIARFYLESADPRAATVELPQSGLKLGLAPTPAITEGDIVNVEIAQVELGRCLMFQLTPAAARDLYRFTAANQGGRLVLTINGAAFGARRIDAPIADGALLVFAELPDSALPALVANLKQTSAGLQRAAAKRP